MKLTGIYTGQTEGTGLARGKSGHFRQIHAWGKTSKTGTCPVWKTQYESGGQYQLVRKLLNSVGLPQRREITYQPGPGGGSREDREIAKRIVMAMTHRGSLPCDAATAVNVCKPGLWFAGCIASIKAKIVKQPSAAEAQWLQDQ